MVKSNPTAAGAAAEVLKGAAKGKSKLSLRELRLKRGHKGGYIAGHEMRGEQGESESHDYPITSFKDLVAHLQEHMGEEAQEAATEKSGGQGEG